MDTSDYVQDSFALVFFGHSKHVSVEFLSKCISDYSNIYNLITAQIISALRFWLLFPVWGPGAQEEVMTSDGFCFHPSHFLQAM